MYTLKHFSLTALSAALLCALGPAHAQTAQDQLQQRLEQLSTEMEKLKNELKAMKERQATSASVAPASAPTQPATTLTAYGEINYTRPRKDTSATQADVARFVTGFAHRFNDRTKVVAELEVEHAVTSKEDDGEVAVEQVYVEHKLTDQLGLRGGLFLMPLGMLNTSHEPHTFYGVQRNFVETAIIPTTWREVGLQLFGEHDNGISWTAALSTGFDLTKWDPTSSENVESPLGAIHQEGQFAKSKDLALSGSVDWRAIPGLRVGAGLFTGKASHGTAGFAAPGARTTLWDVHAKWTPGPWDFSAVYAKGTISGAADLNTTFAGAAFPVPKAFDGWYVQGARKFRLGGDYALAPFVRYERYNTGKSFDGLVGAANPGSYATEGVTTVGLNFNIAPTVVLKADYQRFKVTTDSDRFNVGLGFAF